jgi:hypothetical protein
MRRGILKKEAFMKSKNPTGAVLDFLTEWEEGNSPALEDFIASDSHETTDLLDLVADCVIFDALAHPVHLWPAPTRA